MHSVKFYSKKNILDGRAIPARLANSFFKYLLGQTPTFSDLECYDVKSALFYLRLKATPGSERFQLSFEDGQKVTDANKKNFVDKKTFEILVGCRRRQLEEIKRGFYSVDLSQFWKVLSASELMLMACGQQFLSASMVIECIKFYGFSESSLTVKNLLEVLNELTSNNLRRFLYLTTAHCSLPINMTLKSEQELAGSLAKNTPFLISIRIADKKDLDIAQQNIISYPLTRELELPDYKEIDLIRDQLLKALASIIVSDML